MYRPSLKLVVLALALLYVLGGVACVVQMRQREDLLIAWTLLAGLCFFLAAGIWRLSSIARMASVTVLWVLVLAGIVAALQPSYFPELKPAFDHPALRGRPEILVVPASLALVGLWVLWRNKNEFR